MKTKKLKWRAMSAGETRNRVIGYVYAHTEQEAYAAARAKFGPMGFSYVEMM
jgi:hypothetical protein